MYRPCLCSSWTIPADIVVDTQVKRFYNHSIGVRSYLLKGNFKCNLQRHHFVYIYKIIIRCFLSFISCLYFSLALIRCNSRQCHLMEIFKSKESFRGKFDSNNNWKTAWLFLRLFLGFVWKILSFAGKDLSFIQKMSVCFLKRS